MKKENKKQVPGLKLNEGTLQGGFKALIDCQKDKIRGGKSSNMRICKNFIICWIKPSVRF